MGGTRMGGTRMGEKRSGRWEERIVDVLMKVMAWVGGCTDSSRRRAVVWRGIFRSVLYRTRIHMHTCRCPLTT
jgi:hypothetical protein